MYRLTAGTPIAALPPCGSQWVTKWKLSYFKYIDNFYYFNRRLGNQLSHNIEERRSPNFQIEAD